ncbi:MAG TPA: DUF4831 family protein [Pyrinomonadaceae bacterium]|jgi:hypothetical protein
MSCKELVLYTLITFAIAMTAGCGGETVVTRVDLEAKPGSQANEGVLFSLPETVVMAEVPLTKVSSSPGIYSNWTPFFYPELTSDNFTTEQKTVFKVGLATFTTRGQADPNNVYVAHIKAKQFETKALLLEFNEDGIVARTEASSKDDSIDVVTSGIKTVASIVAPLIRGGAGIPFSDNNSFKGIDNLPDRSEAVAPDLNCEEKLAKARQASEQAAKAAEKAETSGKTADAKAADTARQAAQALYVEFGACTEKRFKNQLQEDDRALYESLDVDYKRFLRENFGYQFLTYLAKREVSEGSTGMQFFFTLNKKQQDFIDKQKHGSSPCEVWPSAKTMCLATEVKLELLKAKTAYDKILELRKKRQDTLFQSTGNDVNTSAQLEFRLKELDAQIKSLEQTFFLGTSSETSGAAKFEFRPGDGSAKESKALFAYSRGGSKPGICEVTREVPGVFKALVPEQLKGDCHTPDYLVSTGDLRDGKVLIKRLREHATADQVSYYLYDQRLTRGTRALIDVSSDDDKPQVRAQLLAALLADLKTVIEGANIYDDTRAFQSVDLSGATLELRKEIAKLDALPTLTSEQTASRAQLIIRLNRSLLDDAYPKELYRQSAWAAHQVSLSIDEKTAGLATSVGGRNLRENGRRGFPYRIAAITMAKVLDDEIEMGRSSVRIAQFGPVQSLPANLGGRRSSYKITYYDSTGAIKVFDMSADALIQKSNVTDLTDAATTLRDSEANGLKRETELLELKKKKLDAEKALKEAAKEEPSPSPSPEP